MQWLDPSNLDTRLLTAIAVAALVGCGSEDDPPTMDGSSSDTGAPIECSAAASAPTATAVGEAPGDHLGTSVSSAGDVNGDGFEDLIVGAPRSAQSNADSGRRPGRAHVLLGPFNDPAIDTTADAWTIIGEHDQHHPGTAVAGIGDIDGDGLDDLYVGAAQSCIIDTEPCHDDCPPPICDPGPFRGYVVYGSREPGDVALADLDATGAGFTVETADPVALTWHDAVGLGDVDGDGLDDFAIGSRSAEQFAGRVWVVFGRTQRARIDLDGLQQQSGGFAIRPEGPDQQFAAAIDAAGDVNGDGRPDVIIGAPSAAQQRGRVYVVFGKPDSEPIEIAALVAGSGAGFAITGELEEFDTGSAVGFAVAGIGDTNGDGLSEVAVAAPLLDRPGTPNTGRAYVVFGRAAVTEIELANLDAGAGYVINGGDRVGNELSAGGDVTGDGIPDLLVSTTAAGLLVPGKADSTPVDLDLAVHGLPAPAGAWQVRAGSLVSDLNCDERADVVVLGAHDAGAVVALQ